MECPVCSKKYSSEKIEEHVDECLSSTNLDKNVQVKQQTKRSYPFAEAAKDSSSKKQKISSTVGSASKMSDDKNEEKFNPFAAKKSMILAAGNRSAPKDKNVPLSELLRPADLESYVGQRKLLGAKSLLRRLLKNGEVTSMILWGPPGCGKTSLANVIAKSIKVFGKMRFVKLSATSSGIGDIREAVSSAHKQLKLNIRTVLFMDEIHRFNKLQQDIFLPHVEGGTFILIGATTENPSFSLNSALLSRCRVFELERLTSDETMTILERGIFSLSGVLTRSNTSNLRASEENNVPTETKFIIDEEAAQWLADTSNGDARVALGSLEIAAKARISNKSGSSLAGAKKISVKIGIEDLRAGLERIHTIFEGKCELKYDLVSAMHKSVRAGDSNACLYWLARLMACGEDPVYIAKRLIRIASEDIGLEDPEAMEIAVHAMHACQMIGMPECDVMLSQCAVYMARASKSRTVNDALRKAENTIVEHKGPQPMVPLHIRCRGGEGKLQASLGAARIHLLRKKDDEGVKHRLPAGLENINFFD